MIIKNELENYEIGGIGEIKKCTLRFHSYRIGKEDGFLTIYAEYQPDKPPKVFKGYPSGQELLIDLCNLHLGLRNKTEEECAEMLMEWCKKNIHPYYFYGDGVAQAEGQTNPEEFWDMMVNVLDTYYIHVSEMVRNLEMLYNDTMTIFAIRKLIEGDIAEAQRIYADVRVPDDKNLLQRWYSTKDNRKHNVIQDFMDKLPKLNMKLQYDCATGQTQLQPSVDSVIDAAYFGLYRFMAVNAEMLEDYGGKTSIAFCQACGRAFIKQGNRQKYCGTPACQSVRNSNKSREYYYRNKKTGQI